jgi:SAM-dependent methyltransferase
MNQGVKSLLGTDWRQAWVEHFSARKIPDNVQVWDSRAKEFSQNAGVSSYAEAFIDYLQPEPKASILDMGSGSGTLAIPLAQQGHSIIAADFSLGMLDILVQTARQQNLTNIRSVELDFNAPWDVWEAAGITEGCVDIALASRSTIVDDLWAAFEKLERAARLRVATTLATEYTPRGIKPMNERKDDGSYTIPDHIYAVNILMQMGRYPSLHYIDSYKPNEQGEQRLVRWAFLSWDVCPKIADT